MLVVVGSLVVDVSSNKEASLIVCWPTFESEKIYLQIKYQIIITNCSTNCYVIVNENHYQLVINITNNNKWYYCYIILQNYIIFYCSTSF